MATLVVQQQPLRKSRTPPPPVSSGVNVDASKFRKGPVPNKHIPYCSPGPAPSTQLPRPATPQSSPSAQASRGERSLLYPPHAHSKLLDEPAVYSIDAQVLSQAIDHLATNPLPDPKLVFPWLHGLHSENQVQQAFFIARRKSHRKIPSCIRGITVVKVGGDLTKAKLKGAIAPAEILAPTSIKDSTFFDVDPKEGFSVRNFHIQAAKFATVSDIIIYKDDSTRIEELRCIAKRFRRAQRRYREKCAASNMDIEEYNTFAVTSPFKDFEERYPELVAITSDGKVTGKVVDFFQLERQEMCRMSKASPIAPNVWLGPTPDPSIIGAPEEGQEEAPEFDIMIEASDLARIPEAKSLKEVAEASADSPQAIEFPSSGSIMLPTWSHAEVDGLLDFCRWIYTLSSGELTPEPSDDGHELEKDHEGDIQMQTFHPHSRRVLIHCADGYTESSLLAIAYFMYAECIPVHEAWIRLHAEKQRNFFAYPSDVSLLTAIQPRIMQESPRGQGNIPSRLPEDPSWLRRLDGSLPSRILPYMYLGNLGHANNPDLLKEIGIKRVLSVGEPVGWSKEQLDGWGVKNLMYIDRVQDNGVDPLTEEFERSLDFIRRFLILLPIELPVSNKPNRIRKRRENSDPSALPCWGFTVCHCLHCGSHGILRSLFPSSIVSLSFVDQAILC